MKLMPYDLTLSKTSDSVSERHCWAPSTLNASGSCLKHFQILYFLYQYF